MFSQRAAGQIWPMVKCWTTIREARDGLQTYWPPRRFRIRERYALVPNTVARTFDAGGSRARETGRFWRGYWRGALDVPDTATRERRGDA